MVTTQELWQSRVSGDYCQVSCTFLAAGKVVCWCFHSSCLCDTCHSVTSMNLTTFAFSINLNIPSLGGLFFITTVQDSPGVGTAYSKSDFELMLCCLFV